MKPGPLESSLNNDDDEGIVKQELWTYRVKKGSLVLDKIVRNYTSSGDYTDHSTSEPLIKME